MEISSTIFPHSHLPAATIFNPWLTPTPSTSAIKRTLKNIYLIQNSWNAWETQKDSDWCKILPNFPPPPFLKSATLSGFNVGKIHASIKTSAKGVLRV